LFFQLGWTRKYQLSLDRDALEIEVFFSRLYAVFHKSKATKENTPNIDMYREDTGQIFTKPTDQKNVG